MGRAENFDFKFDQRHGENVLLEIEDFDLGLQQVIHHGWHGNQ